MGPDTTLHIHDVTLGGQPIKLNAIIPYVVHPYDSGIGVAMSGDRRRLAFAAGSWRLQGGSVVIVAELDLSAAKPIVQRNHLLNETAKVTGLALSHDGRNLALCDTDGQLIYWSLSPFAKLYHYAEAGFTC